MCLLLRGSTFTYFLREKPWGRGCRGCGVIFPQIAVEEFQRLFCFVCDVVHTNVLPIKDLWKSILNGTWYYHCLESRQQPRRVVNEHKEMKIFDRVRGLYCK